MNFYVKLSGGDLVAMTVKIEVMYLMATPFATKRLILYFS
jgi:hypothetical protein